LGSSFETEVFGKWILAGEHAVLRGSPALVFPLHSRSFRLQHFPSSSDLKIVVDGSHGDEFKLLVYGVIEKACELSGVSRSQVRGDLRLSSNIPAGAGLGASAALCSAIARMWVSQFGWPEAEAYSFAKSLEDVFHGESSGVDVAVALSNQGLKFSRNGLREKLTPLWSPVFRLSYTGRRGVTKDCVQKVKDLIQKDPAKAEALDMQMKNAVQSCEQALCVSPSEDQLVQAIQMAQGCFEAWGLCEGDVREHVNLLQQSGAQAVKMTGSGGGGFVLSLWKDEAVIPDSLNDMLISCTV
jgi:mevalonate kinase